MALLDLGSFLPSSLPGSLEVLDQILPYASAEAYRAQVVAGDCEAFPSDALEPSPDVVAYPPDVVSRLEPDLSSYCKELAIRNGQVLCANPNSAVMRPEH